FNDRFRLSLPRVTLRLDHRIRRNCAGYFLPGHNEFGLVYEIAVAVPSPEQLAGMDRGDLLGTLLHEQFHLLQELTGIRGKDKGNYHNAQYRATAEGFWAAGRSPRSPAVRDRQCVPRSARGVWRGAALSSPC